MREPRSPVGPDLLRQRRVRILATLGPASRAPDTIAALVRAGADAFRLNMSHGQHRDHRLIFDAIRRVERDTGRAIAILADLQGPKFRVGAAPPEGVAVAPGQAFTFDDDPAPATAARIGLPHPELHAALRPGARLLVDDGKLAFRVAAVAPGRVEAIAENGGVVRSAKGVNVPDVIVPTTALTDKDRRDLDFALDLGVDWIALSFVQRADDVAELRRLVGARAAVLAKLEKPAAIDQLDPILELADAVMVARGDLGVELPPAEVPAIQKRIVKAARRAGKPVVVATQMLESMISSPVPTRAEVSDVANAIYDGADAVMLSAESASGQYPVEAVAMMDDIARRTEADPDFARRVHFVETEAEPTSADALAEAAAQIARTVGAAAVVCFTLSGSTARRAARERIDRPLLALTPDGDTARRLGLVYGVHAIRTRDVRSFEEMIGKAKRMALRAGVAAAGDRLVIIAGVPFGTPGSTNVVHIARVAGDEHSSDSDRAAGLSA